MHILRSVLKQREMMKNKGGTYSFEPNCTYLPLPSSARTRTQPLLLIALFIVCFFVSFLRNHPRPCYFSGPLCASSREDGLIKLIYYYNDGVTWHNKSQFTRFLLVLFSFFSCYFDAYRSGKTHMRGFYCQTRGPWIICAFIAAAALLVVYTVY